MLESEEKLHQELVSVIKSESRLLADHLNAINNSMAIFAKVKKPAEPTVVTSPVQEENTSSFAYMIESLSDTVINGIADMVAPIFVKTAPDNFVSAPPAIPAPKTSTASPSAGTPVENPISVEVTASPKGEELAIQQAKVINSVFEMIGTPISIPPEFFSSIHEAVVSAGDLFTRSASAPDSSGMKGVAQAAAAKESEAEKKSRVWAEAIQANDRAKEGKAARSETPSSTLAATPTTVDTVNKIEKATSRLVESGNPVSDKELEAFRSSMLKAASTYEDFARSLREKAASPIDLDRLAEVIAMEKNRKPVPAPGSSPASQTAETAASMPARAVESISFSMPDNFVRSLSAQVAEMTKSQVVPAIVDGFAQAIRQGFSA
jgi:hypothetical protein